MNITHYNIIIGILTALIGFFVILPIFIKDHNDTFIAITGIVIAVLLFIISLKIERISTVRMFALLEPNKRKILEELEQERTLDELKLISNDVDYCSKLHENLEDMKRLGLVKVREQFDNSDGSNKRIKKFIRSF